MVGSHGAQPRQGLAGPVGFAAEMAEEGDQCHRFRSGAVLGAGGGQAVDGIGEARHVADHGAQVEAFGLHQIGGDVQALGCGIHGGVIIGTEHQQGDAREDRGEAQVGAEVAGLGGGDLKVDLQGGGEGHRRIGDAGGGEVLGSEADQLAAAHALSLPVGEDEVEGQAQGPGPGFDIRAESLGAVEGILGRTEAAHGRGAPGQAVAAGGDDLGQGVLVEIGAEILVAQVVGRCTDIDAEADGGLQQAQGRWEGGGSFEVGVDALAHAHRVGDLGFSGGQEGGSEEGGQEAGGDHGTVVPAPEPATSDDLPLHDDSRVGSSQVLWATELRISQFLLGPRWEIVVVDPPSGGQAGVKDTMMPPAVSSECDDAALVQAWAAGDDGAFAAIVDRYLDLVYARCRRSLAPADADDAAQAVFLVLLRKGLRGPVAQRLAPWLFTTADFVVRNARRDLGRRQRRHPDIDVGIVPSQEETTMDADLAAAIEDALAELPAQEREAIRLHHLAGKSIAEVGRLQSAPPSTIASRVERGLARLRGLLGRRGVQAGMTMLITALTASATAAAPADLHATIRSWDPSGTTPLPTAGGVSSRALQWSKPRIPMAALLSSTLAGLALAAGAVTYALAADPLPPAGDPPPVTATEPELSPFFFDPVTHDTVMVLDVPEVGATWRRIRALPEAAPFAPILDGADWARTLEGIGSLQVAVDPQSLLTAADAEPLRQATIAADAEGPDREFFVTTARQQATSSPTIHIPRLRGVLTGQPGALTAIQEAGWLGRALGAWAQRAELESSAEGSLRFAGPTGSLALQGPDESGRDAFVLQGDPGHGERPWTWADLPRREGGALVISGWARPKSGGAVVPMMSFDLDFDEVEGLRASSWIAHASVGESRRTQAQPQGGADLLAEVPADAIAAWAMRMSPGVNAQNPFLLGILLPLELEVDQSVDGPGSPFPEHQARVALLHALQAILQDAEGTLLAIVRPGPLIPIVGLSLPRPADPAPLFDALRGLGFQEGGDGSVQMLAGMVNVQVGIDGDRLIVTNAPSGVAGLHAGAKGFAEQADVADFLGHRSSAKGYHLGVLRQGPLLDQVAPLIAATLDADQQRDLLDLQERLRSEPRTGGFLIHHDERGVHFEAAGVLPVAASLAITAKNLGIPVGVN